MNKPKFKAGKTLWSVVVMDNGAYHTRTDIISVKKKYDSFEGKAVPCYLLRFNASNDNGTTSEFWTPCYCIDEDYLPNGYQPVEQYRGMYFNSERRALRYLAESHKFLSAQAEEYRTRYN